MIELCKRFLFQRQMWRNLYHHLPIIQSIMSKNSCNTNSNMQCTLFNPLINRIIKSCIKLEWTWKNWSCILSLDLLVHFYLIRVAFIWSIFIRAVINHMTCHNLNWSKIKFIILSSTWFFLCFRSYPEEVEE